MNDLADKQNFDQSKKKLGKAGLVVLLFLLGFIGLCVAIYFNHRAALEDSYHEYAKSINRFPIGELIAAHMDQNPQKVQLLSHLDGQLYSAELFALKKDYPKMHETFSDAIQTAKQLFGPKSEFLRTIYMAQGNHECDFKKWEPAIEAYSHAIDIYPNDAIAYNCRARAYFEEEQHQSAIDDLTKAIALDSKSIGLYRFRALEFGKLGKYEEALADYETIITLTPNDKQAIRCREYMSSRLKIPQK